VLKCLANRLKVTKNKTIPKVTNLGKFFAVAALLVPIGAPLLMTSLRNIDTASLSKPLSWMLLLTFVAGIMFAFAPAIVLLCNFFRIHFVHKKAGTGLQKEAQAKVDGDKTDGDDELGDWAFVGSHTITETKQETIETPQPTSIEFQDVFCKVMREALNSDWSRKLIMVLDNLDRVDEKDALSIWSTLQTFLQCRNGETEDWFKKTWIVIPYDPDGLRKLWMNGTSPKHETPSEAKHGTPSEETKGKSVLNESQTVPQSFMDKSFQLRFRVPPLLLSNWKAYLKRLAHEALPQHSPEELHGVYQVFRLARVKPGEPPTPRELKIYINQIGTIHRQWQDEFPLDHVAYYTILSREGVNIRDKLLEDGWDPDRALQSILSPNYRASLAGLYYNVDPELGQELLLTSQINYALKAREPEQLITLEKLYGNGFWAVLDDRMKEMVGENVSAPEAADAAVCLDVLNRISSRQEIEIKSLAASLKLLTLSVTAWAPLDSHITEGILAACRVVSDPYFSTRILKSLAETIDDPRLKHIVPIKGDTILMLAQLCEGINEMKHLQALTPFSLQISGSEWVALCPSIRSCAEQWWPFFRPSRGFEDVLSAFRDIVTGGKFSLATLDAIALANQSLPDCDWSSLAKSLEQRLGASADPSTAETNLLLQGLSLLDRLRCAQAQDALKRLADDGHLMHRLHQAYSKGDTACLARVLTVFLVQRPAADNTPNPPGSTGEGYNDLSALLGAENQVLAKEMVTILDAEGKISTLLEIIDKRDNYDALIVAALCSVADSEKPERLFKPDVVMKRWEKLLIYLNQHDPDRFNKLLGRLCKNSSLVETLRKKDAGFAVQEIPLYQLICSVHPSQEFLDWCRRGLEGLEYSVWKEQVEEYSIALDLLLFLVKNGVEIHLRQPFQDALAEHAKGLAAGTTGARQKHVDEWPKLLQGLTSSSREGLRRRLLSEAIDREGQCPDIFFQMYGQELAADISILRDDKQLVPRLFSPILRERNLEGLRWMNDLFKKAPNLLNELTDQAGVDEFLERLQGEPSAPTGQENLAHEIIVDIANSLGIVLKPMQEVVETNGGEAG